MPSAAPMPPGTEDGPQDPFGTARDRIDTFVAANFSLAGSFRLHRRALGLDLLRAPLNVLLAPPHALMRLAGFVARLVGARRLADRIGLRSLILRTCVAREVEERLVRDLFGLPVSAEDPRPIARILEETPEFRALLRQSADPEAAAGRTRRAAATINAYSGTRSAVAEMTTALLTVLFGAYLFRTLTPGMVSMAPALADTLARETAISAFPLGSGAGTLWYGMFPVGASLPEIVSIAAGLLALASVITAFAGVLADPIQARLGLHRARLRRMIDAVESDLGASPSRPYSAREHYYARLFDLLDIGSGLFRHFR